ncbi:c-type cytochrome, partial [Massilia terrae]
MNTTTRICAGLATLALVACAGRGTVEGGGGANAGGGAPQGAGAMTQGGSTQGSASQTGGGRSVTAAEPGGQPTQAAMMQEQQAQGGAALALGQPGASAAPPAGPAQPQAGEQIASKGTPNGVTACVACHGAQGEGNAAGGFPRIAGQSAWYIGKQLAAYANGARVNPVMEPVAKGLSAEQIRDVAAYYASLGGGAGSAASAGAKAAGGAAARGLLLATKGDEVRRVQACANCHGPGGAGEPPASPYLAGQHANYLSAAMQAWKSGARKTDPSGQMVEIARALNDADVAAIAAFFSAQPAPPPAGKLVNVATGTAAHPAVAAAAGA